VVARATVVMDVGSRTACPCALKEVPVEQREMSEVRWSIVRCVATALAALLLLPFLLLAVVPMALMLVPVAVVGIPLMAPVMLSGFVTARYEAARRVRSVRTARTTPASLTAR
jgi:hypothetical protein